MSTSANSITNIHISVFFNDIKTCMYVIVVAVIVSSSLWSYITTIMIILSIVSFFNIMEMYFNSVTFSCSSPITIIFMIISECYSVFVNLVWVCCSLTTSSSSSLPSLSPFCCLFSTLVSLLLILHHHLIIIFMVIFISV